MDKCELCKAEIPDGKDVCNGRIFEWCKQYAERQREEYTPRSDGIWFDNLGDEWAYEQYRDWADEE